MGRGWWFRGSALLQGCRSSGKTFGQGSYLQLLWGLWNKQHFSSLLFWPPHLGHASTCIPLHHHHALHKFMDGNWRVFLYISDWKVMLKDVFEAFPDAAVTTWKLMASQHLHHKPESLSLLLLYLYFSLVPLKRRDLQMLYLLFPGTGNRDCHSWAKIRNKASSPPSHPIYQPPPWLNKDQLCD